MAIMRWVVAAACCAVASASPSMKPNFVILFVDDMGIDQIQVPPEQRAYGYTGNNGTIKTPAVYKLASEGMVFQTWYSGFHVCTPSRAAMMTGRLPVRSGIGSPNGMYAPNAPGPSQGNNVVFTGESVGGLPLNETTMAEALRPHGYATLCVGKWHLGQRDIYLPTSRGFEEYLGIPFSQDIGLSFWATHNYKPQPPYFPTPLPLLANTTVLEQPADLFTIALKYASISTRFIAANAAAGKPFLLYLPFNHIHGPNSCGARWCGQSARGPVGDATEETDWVVGQIMDQIEASQVGDNTLVFFTSDNGSPVRPDGNLPLRGYKGSVWEGGYREPGIAWWPGKIKPGSSSNALVATYDIFPTVLSLAGVVPPAVTLDGVDISPVLFGESDTAHDCVIFYKYPHASTVRTEPTNIAAVRCGDHKVYWYMDAGGPPGTKAGVQPDGKPTVFDLVADPGESAPLPASSPAYAAAVGAATAARSAHVATIEVVPDQNARGNNNAFAICGAPDSKSRYPQLPNCTLTPQFWNISICGSPDTKWCNETAAGACPADCPHMGPPPAPLPPPVPVPASNYVGCFIDHVKQQCDLPHPIQGHCGTHSVKVPYAMTPAVCNELCLRANASFEFFANQMGNACFCGNSYGRFGKAPATDCNVTCAGDPKQFCGGPNRNSVWKTVPLA